MITIHSQDGRHFLGLRHGRKGGYEIVYDGGPHRRRFVLRLRPPHVVKDIEGHLYNAIKTTDVLTTLYSGLRTAEIEFEIDHDQVPR